jgi:hypothetical protein
MQTEPSKLDSPKCNRRWFRFPLRTLLILVAVLVIALAYVGSQANIVRQRDAALRKAIKAGGITFRPKSDAEANMPEELRGAIPLVRRRLGDRAVVWIYYAPSTPPDEVRRLQELFPETRIDSISATPLGNRR